MDPWDNGGKNKVNPVTAPLSWKQLPNPKAEQGSHAEQEGSKVEDTGTGVQGGSNTWLLQSWVPDRKSCEDNRLQGSEMGSPWVCGRIPSYACAGQAPMGLGKEQLPRKEQLRGAGRHLECPIETPKNGLSYEKGKWRSSTQKVLLDSTVLEPH